MNNNKHEVTKEEVGEAMWDLLAMEAKKHRTAYFEQTFEGESHSTIVRCGIRYYVTMNSKKKGDIKVEQYEQLFH